MSKEEKVKKILDESLEDFALTVSRTSSYGSSYKYIRTEDIAKRIIKLFSPPPVVGDLRDKVGAFIYILMARPHRDEENWNETSWENLSEINKEFYRKYADSILSIIKEAGWVKLDFVLNKLSMYKGHGIEQLIEYLKQAGG